MNPPSEKTVKPETLSRLTTGTPVPVLGMPLVRKMEPDIWEVRSDISDGIARVLFTVTAVMGGKAMLLLHGFVKKSRQTPKTDLDTARDRLKQHQMFERKSARK